MTATPRGVGDDDVSATASVMDPTNDDSIDRLSDGGVEFPDQEMVNEDSIDRFSDGGVEFPDQEMVNQDIDSSDAPKMEECAGGQEIGPPGSCTSLHYEVRPTLQKSTRVWASPR